MRDAEEALGEVVVGGSGGPSVDDEDDGGVQERALARCHASLLSVVEKMQRVEEEKGEGEGEGNSRGGGAGGEKALPTYESSRNDERVMPWEYRPEGDVAIKPPLMRRKFIKSRREQASAEVVEGNMGRGELWWWCCGRMEFFRLTSYSYPTANDKPAQSEPP